ncbi:hypothetical protein BDF21DRAFT_455097 [Thamnidium elegans]|nr:hypothetical protein BDF21DRAFT_455097 [Thamnidium elegans]
MSKKKFGSDAIRVLGNWSVPLVRIQELTRDIGLIKALKKNGLRFAAKIPLTLIQRQQGFGIVIFVVTSNFRIIFINLREEGLRPSLFSSNTLDCNQIKFWLPSPGNFMQRCFLLLRQKRLKQTDDYFHFFSSQNILD